MSIFAQNITYGSYRFRFVCIRSIVTSANSASYEAMHSLYYDRNGLYSKLPQDGLRPGSINNTGIYLRRKMADGLVSGIRQYGCLFLSTSDQFHRHCLVDREVCFRSREGER